MAHEDKFELKLELNLERISMISVSEILWKSPDITKRIDKFFDGQNLKIYSGREMVYRAPERYDLWEGLMCDIFTKVSVLSLPCKVEKDLRRIIILMGEKIHYFYACKCHKCKWCRSVFGNHHFYSLSSLGILKLPCSSFHWKYSPKNEDLVEFLHEACTRCDEKLICEYQDRIVAYLESAEPGLSLKDKKDIPFNIMCVWNYKFSLMQAGHEVPYKLPKNYLKNVDYIIPLENVYKMCYGYSPPPDNLFQIFASKFPHLLSKLDLSLYAETYLNIYVFRLVYCVCVPHNFSFRFENISLKNFLFSLQFLTSSQMLNLFEKHLDIIILIFLPVWPYLELVPRILSFCFERKFNLNYDYLLELVTLAIGFQNVKIWPGKKVAYLRIFRMLWNQAPEEEKLLFFKKRVKYYVANEVNIPIMELILDNDDYKKNPADLDRVIENKYKTLSNGEKIDFLMKFLEEVIISEGELKEFTGRYVNFQFLKYYDCKGVRIAPWLI